MNQDVIIEKIKKALRLARKAGTEGERQAAEAAAKRMAENNGIALDSVSVDDAGVDKTGADDGEKWTTLTGCEVGFAGGLLWTHFGVKMVISSRRERNVSKYRYTFFGTRINIEVAKYAFDIMLRESRRAWNEVKEWRGMGGGIDKQLFMQGWFANIHAKLTANPIRNDVEVFEAEKAKTEEDYKKFKEERGVESKPQKLRKVSEREAAKRYDSLEAGFDAAAKVSLNRPCGGTATVRPEVGETKFLNEAVA